MFRSFPIHEKFVSTSEINFNFTRNHAIIFNNTEKKLFKSELTNEITDKYLVKLAAVFVQFFLAQAEVHCLHALIQEFSRCFDFRCNFEFIDNFKFDILN